MAKKPQDLGEHLELIERQLGYTGSIPKYVDLHWHLCKIEELLGGGTGGGTVQEYASYEDFPEVGEEGKLYIALDDKCIYIYVDGEYVKVGGSGAGTLTGIKVNGEDLPVESDGTVNIETDDLIVGSAKNIYTDRTIEDLNVSCPAITYGVAGGEAEISTGLQELTTLYGNTIGSRSHNTYKTPKSTKLISRGKNQFQGFDTFTDILSNQEYRIFTNLPSGLLLTEYDKDKQTDSDHFYVSIEIGSDTLIDDCFASHGDEFMFNDGARYIKLEPADSTEVSDDTYVMMYLTFGESYAELYEEPKAEEVILPNLYLRSWEGIRDEIYSTGGGIRRIGAVTITEDDLYEYKEHEYRISFPHTENTLLWDYFPENIYILYSGKNATHTFYTVKKGDNPSFKISREESEISFYFTDRPSKKEVAELLEGVFISYKLDQEEKITKEENPGWKKEIFVDNYGTLLFLDENGNEVLAEQAYQILYKVDLKEFLDSSYVKAAGNASNIALESDIEDGNIIAGLAENLHTNRIIEDLNISCPPIIFGIAGGEAEISSGEQKLTRLFGNTEKIDNYRFDLPAYKSSQSGRLISIGKNQLFNGLQDTNEVVSGQEYKIFGLPSGFLIEEYDANGDCIKEEFEVENYGVFTVSDNTKSIYIGAKEESEIENYSEIMLYMTFGESYNEPYEELKYNSIYLPETVLRSFEDVKDEFTYDGKFIQRVGFMSIKSNLWSEVPGENYKYRIAKNNNFDNFIVENIPIVSEGENLFTVRFQKTSGKEKYATTLRISSDEDYIYIQAYKIMADNWASKFDNFNVKVIYKLDEEIVNTGEETWDPTIYVDNFGTLHFTDTEAKQPYEILYSVNLKEFLDSSYVKASGNASDIALESDLTEGNIIPAFTENIHTDRVIDDLAISCPAITFGVAGGDAEIESGNQEVETLYGNTIFDEDESKYISVKSNNLVSRGKNQFIGLSDQQGDIIYHRAIPNQEYKIFGLPNGFQIRESNIDKVVTTGLDYDFIENGGTFTTQSDSVYLEIYLNDWSDIENNPNPQVMLYLTFGESYDEPYEEPKVDSIKLPNIVLRSFDDVRDEIYATGGGIRRVGVLEVTEENLFASGSHYAITGISLDTKIIPECCIINDQQCVGPGTAFDIYLPDADTDTWISTDEGDYISIGFNHLYYTKEQIVEMFSGVKFIYKLSEPEEITLEENPGWDSKLYIDNYGTLMFTDYQDDEIKIKQPYQIIYKVNLKEFLDSSFVRAAGNASDIALESDLTSGNIIPALAENLHTERVIDDLDISCPPITFGIAGGDAEISSGDQELTTLYGNTIEINNYLDSSYFGYKSNKSAKLTSRGKNQFQGLTEDRATDKVYNDVIGGEEYRIFNDLGTEFWITEYNANYVQLSDGMDQDCPDENGVFTLQPETRYIVIEVPAADYQEALHSKIMLYLTFGESYDEPYEATKVDLIKLPNITLRSFKGVRDEIYSTGSGIRRVGHLPINSSVWTQIDETHFRVSKSSYNFTLFSIENAVWSAEESDIDYSSCDLELWSDLGAELGSGSIYNNYTDDYITVSLYAYSGHTITELIECFDSYNANIIFELAEGEEITLEENPGWDSKVYIDNYGTLIFQDSEGNEVNIEQAYQIRYKANLKELLDSTFVRTLGNASDIALVSELENGDTIPKYSDNLTPYSSTSGPKGSNAFLFQTAGGDQEVNDKAYLNKLTGNTYKIVQLIKNGNFEDGTNYFDPYVDSQNFSVENNVLTITGTSSGGNKGIVQVNIPLNSDSNHEYALKFNASGLNLKQSEQKGKVKIQFRWSRNNRQVISNAEEVYSEDIYGNKFSEIIFGFSPHNFDYRGYDSLDIIITQYISSTSYDYLKITGLQLFDLTVMRDLATYNWDVLQYIDFTGQAGKFISARSSAYKIIGYNACNEQIKIGYVINPTTGQEFKEQDNQHILTDFIKVVPGEDYTIECKFDDSNIWSDYEIAYYDSNQNYLYKDGSGVDSNIVTIPHNCLYVRITYNTDYDAAAAKSHPCFHLTWDESKTGYEKHYEKVYTLPNIELKRCNDIYDELKPDGTLIQRLSDFELSACNWVNRRDIVDICFSTDEFIEQIKLSEDTSMIPNIAVSGIYKIVSFDDLYENHEDLTMALDDEGYLYICDSRIYNSYDEELDEFDFSYLENIHLLFERAEYTESAYPANKFDELTIIDNWGTQEFIGSIVSQGNILTYVADYKAFLDTLSARSDINYNANIIATKREAKKPKNLNIVNQKNKMDSFVVINQQEQEIMGNCQLYVYTNPSESIRAGRGWMTPSQCYGTKKGNKVPAVGEVLLFDNLPEASSSPYMDRANFTVLNEETYLSYKDILDTLFNEDFQQTDALLKTKFPQLISLSNIGSGGMHKMYFAKCTLHISGKNKEEMPSIFQRCCVQRPKEKMVQRFINDNQSWYFINKMMVKFGSYKEGNLSPISNQWLELLIRVEHDVSVHSSDQADIYIIPIKRRFDGKYTQLWKNQLY